MSEGNGIKITGIFIKYFEKGNLLGFADIVFNEVFRVRGVRILTGNKGDYLSWPARQTEGKEGKPEYYDICFPTREFGDEIRDAVLEKFAKDKDKYSKGGGKSSGGGKGSWGGNKGGSGGKSGGYSSNKTSSKPASNNDDGDDGDDIPF